MYGISFILPRRSTMDYCVFLPYCLIALAPMASARDDSTLPKEAPNHPANIHNVCVLQLQSCSLSVLNMFVIVVIVV